MLNSNQFAILTIDDAVKTLKALTILLSKDGKKDHGFNEKLKKLEIYDFYLSLEEFCRQSSKWDQIQYVDADEIATKDFVYDEIRRCKD